MSTLDLLDPELLGTDIMERLNWLDGPHGRYEGDRFAIGDWKIPGVPLCGTCGGTKRVARGVSVSGLVYDPCPACSGTVKDPK